MLQLRAVSVAAPSRAELPLRAAPRAAALPAPHRAPLRRAATTTAAAAPKKKGAAAAPETAPEPAPLSAPAAAVVYAGVVAIPITFWSEFTLFQTGAGLQGDVLGGIEGVSYLVLLAVLGVSLQKKTSTGVGLEGILPGTLADSVCGLRRSVT